VKSDRIRRTLTLLLCLLVFVVVALGMWQSVGVSAGHTVTTPPLVPATGSTTTLPPVPTTVPATGSTAYVPPVPTTVPAAATTYVPPVPTTVPAAASTTSATEPTTTPDTADEGGLAGGWIALIIVLVVVVVGGLVYVLRKGSRKA
jgi:hypothetical protein